MICHNKALKWIQLHRKVKLHGHRQWNISDSSLALFFIRTHILEDTTFSLWSCCDSAIWQHTNMMHRAFQIITNKVIKAVLCLLKIHSFHWPTVMMLNTFWNPGLHLIFLFLTISYLFFTISFKFPLNYVYVYFCLYIYGF